MGDTFNAFIEFISEDSIMLGLCIAILVLIVMFILVLILGKKKDVKKEVSSATSDDLLKTEINMEALKSTNEYKIDELNSNKDKNTVEIAPSVVENNTDAVEIPVNTEEPVKVEIEEKSDIVSENENDIIGGISDMGSTPISAYPSFEDFKISEPEVQPVVDIPISEESAPVDLGNMSVIESNVAPIEDNVVLDNSPVEETDLEENLDSLNIVESVSVPLEEESSDSTDAVTVLEPISETVLEPIVEEQIEETSEIEEKNVSDEDVSEEVENLEPPIIEAQNSDIPESIYDFVPDEIEDVPVGEEVEEAIIEESQDVENESVEEIEENDLSQVEEQAEENIEDVELPTINDDEDEVELPDYSDLYSVDDIELPNINLDEFKSSSFLPKSAREEVKHKQDDDDLDLPKLNTGANSSLNSLHGESFNIEK